MKSSSSSFRSLITNSLAKFCKNKIKHRVPVKKGQDQSVAQKTHQKVLAPKILRNDQNENLVAAWFGKKRKNRDWRSGNG